MAAKADNDDDAETADDADGNDEDDEDDEDDAASVAVAASNSSGARRGVEQRVQHEARGCKGGPQRSTPRALVRCDRAEPPRQTRT